MGSLTLTADAASIAAILDRLDTTARGLRGTGDPRTLDQLRCDLATAALLRGHLDPATATATAMSTVAATGAPSDAVAAARVWLVVPFEVATGDSDAACELPGHGWVTAAHAREIMTRPGSVWQTLPVDLRDGHAINRPTKGYRPTTGDGRARAGRRRHLPRPRLPDTRHQVRPRPRDPLAGR